MDKAILNTIIAFLMFTPFGQLAQDIETGIKKGHIDITDVEKFLADAVVLAEKIWSKGSPLVDDLRKLVPIFADVAVHYQHAIT